ncbi:hypothetical protein [Shewanella sp. WXL01]|uniref:hypothetical protein n=1 Tax=Shewanella sp. WXL01 TaxID=2709721 RepID=UPI0032B0093E
MSSLPDKPLHIDLQSLPIGQLIEQYLIDNPSASLPDKQCVCASCCIKLAKQYPELVNSANKFADENQVTLFKPASQD